MVIAIGLESIKGSPKDPLRPGFERGSSKPVKHIDLVIVNLENL